MIPSAPTNSGLRESTKARILRRHDALKRERAPWLNVWRTQADFILPRRFRDSNAQRNRPAPNDKLINNTPTQAARTLASGLMSGLTSPARPWFRLAIPGVAASQDVKAWLNQVEQIIREVLIRSNLYNALAHIFGDLGTFCTAAMIVEEDDKDIVRGYVLPLGSFVLTTSARGQVDGIIRDVPMTVAQVAQQFGLESCSAKVRQQHARGAYDDVVDVTHAIEPNPDFIPGVVGTRGMEWRSVWFETKEDIKNERFLRVGGFNEFPVMAPRWNVTGTDTYGTGPGFDALGDAKALQLLERRKAMVVDRITNPPMVAPTALRAGRPSLMPGDVVFVDKIAGSQGFEPAITINPAAIPAIDSVIRAHEQRIQTSFYADLWLAMTMDDRNQRATAREVAERHEEKLLALGPTLERLHDELLDKLLERVFAVCLRRGLFPQPPSELHGQTIRIEYISVMAVAQRLLGVSAVERLVSFAGNMAAAKPEALDKLNVDRIMDEYADMLGTAPGLLYSDDEVAQARQAKAQAAAQQQQQEMALQQGPAMAKSAELLSKADVGGTSALKRLLATQAGGTL